MNEWLKQVLQTLPEKRPRSRLEPYREFIDELRHLGRTYREIAAILADRCQLQVSFSAIHEFVQTRSRGRGETRARSLPDRTKSQAGRATQKAAKQGIAG
jgi:hypothetical protein